MQIPQPEDLAALKYYTMPFGKYADTRLIDLPEAYLAWWQRQGWPAGRLGMLLQLAFEVRINGLRTLVDHIPDQPGQSR